MNLLETLASLIPSTNAASRLASLREKRAEVAKSLGEDEWELRAGEDDKAVEDAKLLLAGKDVSASSKDLQRLRDRISAQRAALVAIDKSLHDAEVAADRARVEAVVGQAIERESQWKRDVCETAALLAAGSVAARKLGWSLDTSTLPANLAESVRIIRDQLANELGVIELHAPAETQFDMLTNGLRSAGATEQDVERVLAARVMSEELKVSAVGLAKSLIGGAEL